MGLILSTKTGGAIIAGRRPDEGQIRLLGGVGHGLDVGIVRGGGVAVEIFIVVVVVGVRA